MRCPKCGAFMEQGKDICFMCGTNAKTYVPANNNNNNNFNRPVDSAFGSGANFNNNNNNNAVFGSGASFNNSNYNQMKENYLNSKKDYRNVELKPVKNGERDMFDFFCDNFI
jgi:predicted  nucleic acid-binding Zn-ribbon protein